MNWLHKLQLRIRALLQKEKLDARMDDEMRSHIEMQTQENIEAGMKPEEARYAALRQFGWVETIKDTCRDQRGVSWIENLGQDIRFGVRMLRKNPGFTAVAVLTLALGIGANTAIFSVVNAVLLRPLPFKEPDQLFLVEAKGGFGVMAGGDFRDLTEHSSLFSNVAAYNTTTLNLSGESDPERVKGMRVSATFFPTFGVEPVRGRIFSPDEDRTGGEKVAVISHKLWRSRFAGDEGTVGRTLKLDGQSYTIIGITPPTAEFPEKPEVFIPLALSTARLNDYGDCFLKLSARLKRGIAPAQGDAELLAITKRVEAQYPDFRKTWSLGLVSLHEFLVGKSVRTMMLVLLGAVGLVVLIACVNLANLLLASNTGRRKELAIRLSLGAAKSRITRQLFTESLLIAGLGTASGLLLALWVKGLINGWLPANIPRVGPISIDSRVLMFTLSISAFAGLFFGLIPAFRISAASLNEALKEGTRSASSGVSHQRLRSLLVISETALTVVLLVGAGLLLKSFFTLQNVSLGFRPESLLTARIVLPSRYSTPQQRLQFQDQLLESVRHFPGVRSAATTSYLPMASGASGYGILIDGQGDKPAGMTGFRSISADYFNTMGIVLLRGRGLTVQDNEQGLPVTVINEAMAKKFWPNDDPIGKRIKPTSSSAVWNEIIGIVGSVRHASVAEEPKPEMYVPNSQSPAPQINLALRATDTANLAGLIRHAVTRLDKDLPVYEIQTMEQRLSESVAQPRFRTLLLVVFASLALLMAIVGIYGVISYSVAQRTHEIGLRIALGAQRSDVLAMVIKQGLTLTLIGLVIGAVGALGASRVLETFLYEVRPTDPATYIGISLLLLVVGLLACFIPARRAAKVDPMVALRYE